MRYAATITFLLVLTAVNGWMNWRMWSNARHPAILPTTRIERDVQVKKIGQQEIFRPQRDESHASPPWAYLETEDYLQFASNLRAAGVPERTLRDILVADIYRNMEEKQVKLAEDAPDTFWMNADQRNAMERAKFRKGVEMKNAQFDLTIELFGYPMNQHALQTSRDEGQMSAIVRLLFGYLDREAFIQLMGTFEYFEHRSESLVALTEGILLDDDIAELNTQADGINEALDKLLTPFEKEELFLRYFITGHYSEMSHAENGFEATGAEFRQAALIVSTPHDLLREAFLSAVDTPEPTDEMREAAEVELAKFLGMERYEEWARAKDERFKEIYQKTKIAKLEKADAVKIFNSLDTAEAQVDSIYADEELKPEEAAVLLIAVKARALSEFKKVVGLRMKPEQRQELSDEIFSELGKLPEEFESEDETKPGQETRKDAR
ncbi:MAG: hypothetical protein CMO80_14920 [Verrucomicrobiales bacterium]|nr:hypothetical protein [Verrucomicrobiales bacterium]